MPRRYVHATRGVPADHYRTAPPFTERDRPARTIAEAIEVAAAGDTIEVLDTHHYREDELTIDKSLTLVSSAVLDPSIPKPTQSGWRPRSYPAISPVRRFGGRVILIRGARQRELRVEIAGFVIKEGQTQNDTPNDPAVGAGAGIAVVDLGTGREERSNPSGLVIRDCYFTNNRTRVVGGGRASLGGLKRVLRGFVENVLGPMETAAGFAERLRDRLPEYVRDRLPNAVSEIVRGMQAARAIVDGYFRQFPDALPNHQLAGQSFGAGLCFVWSSGTVRGCRFETNTVTGRGGGAAVVGYGWPVFDGCQFVRNRARSQTRRDGGGLGVEVGIPERFGRNLRVQHLIDDLEDWLQNIGFLDLAGLAFEFVSGLVDYAISVGFGHQPPPVSLDELAEQAGAAWEGRTEEISLGAELLTVLIHLIVSAYLRERRDVVWNPGHLAAAATSRTLVRRCEFTQNTAHDDGGAVYASVFGRMRLEHCVLRANVAQHGGGGAVRCSMASDIEIETCTITDNRAGGTEFIVGGGAMAVRNAQTIVRGATVITGNQCSDWAGGAVQVSAESEGGATFLGSFGALLPSYYHAIMIQVFGFHQMDVRFANATLVAQNTAGVGRRSVHGKGGGLYVLRGTQIDVPPLTVRVEQYARLVTRNTGHGRPDSGSGTYNNIYLKDLTNGTDVGDHNVRTHLSGGDLRYSSGV